MRIETGQHTATINDIAIDEARGLVVTASDDKTVRMWRLDDGEAVRVLRTPIGERANGQLYAARPAPNGKAYLAAGLTGGIGNGTIWAFTGDKLSLAGGFGSLPGPIQRLAYRSDSKMAAAAFAGPQGSRGIRIWDRNLRPVLRRQGFSSLPVWLEFAADGRLLVATQNGTIRLFMPTPDGGYVPLTAFEVDGGTPHHVRFSPDGRFLAVGYVDATRVDIVNAASGALVKRLEPDDLKGTDLAAVAWVTVEGQAALAASGTVRRQGENRTVARIWRQADFSVMADMQLGRDATTRLEALPDGGFLYATADPAWGRVTPSGKMLYRKDPRSADFRDVDRNDSLSVSPDGSKVTFRTHPKAPRLVIDLERRTVREAKATLQHAVRVQGLGGAWERRSDPSINGRTIRLRPNERVESATVISPMDGILLGTDQTLYWLDSEGRRLAETQVEGTVWGVVAAPEAGIAVTAQGDGTIRWYDLRSSKPLQEIAAFFYQPKSQEWVAWTPSGFFAISERGGRELVGYHLNQGGSTDPRWIEFAQLSRLYYAPDMPLARVRRNQEIIQPKLATLGQASDFIRTKRPPEIVLETYCYVPEEGAQDVCRPLERATRGFVRVREDSSDNQSAAVVVEPEDANGETAEETAATGIRLPSGVGKVDLHFRLIDRGAGVAEFDVFLNGRNTGRRVTRGLSRVRPDAAQREQTFPQEPEAGEGAKRSYTLELDEGVNRITIRAYDTEGVFGESDEVVMNASPRRMASDAGMEPHLHVITVGVDDYAGGQIPRLYYAVADARSFRDTLRSKATTTYDEIHSYHLEDEDVSKENVRALFDEVGRKARATDSILIYFAGHGIVLDGSYYFVTADAPDFEGIRSTSVSQSALVRWISDLPSKNIFVFLDTCHSGAVPIEDVGNLNMETGRLVLAASTDVEEALDGIGGQNGLFATVVLRGLEGEALYLGEVSALALGLYVSEEVPELAKEHNHNQNAEFKATSGNFSRFPLIKP